MSRPNLALKFLQGEGRRTDIPAQTRVGWRQSTDDLSKRGIADHGQVNVARRLVIAAGNRTIDKCHRDAIREGFECLPKGIRRAGCLGEN